MKKLAVLLALFLLIAGETLATLTVLAPWRVEHRVVLLMSRVGHALLHDRTLSLPGHIVIADAGSNAVFPRAIADVQSGAVDEATREFADAVEIPTWDGQSPAPTLSRDELPVWLLSFGPTLQLHGVWAVGVGGRHWELAVGTTDQKQQLGVSEVDALYGAAVREGKISAVTIILSPASRARVGDAISQRGLMTWHPLSGWLVLGPMTILVALAAAFLLRRGRPRWIIVALLALSPLVTVIGFTIADPVGSELGQTLPAQPLYVGHVALALTLEELRDRPGAAVQWTKALSHAQSAGETAYVDQGLARARQPTR